MSALPELPADHPGTDIHCTYVGGHPSPQPTATTEKSAPIGTTWQSAGALLKIQSDHFDQFEAMRESVQNQVRDLRMFKGGEGSPEEFRLQGIVDVLLEVEHGRELELVRAFRTHPLADWQKRTIGVGEKQGARLIAAIGDPYLASKKRPDGTFYIEPRSGPAQLWAYCGLHVLHPGQSTSDSQKRLARVQSLRPDDQSLSDAHSYPVAGTDLCDTADHLLHETPHRIVGGVAPSRRKGRRANWNNTARCRAHLVAKSAMKAGVRSLDGCDDTAGYDVHNRKAITPYGAIYLTGRAKYANAVHNHPCEGCGPKGNPALVGSPLSLKHQHNRALRLIMKAILRDLWLEAKRLHLSAEVA